MGIPLCVICCFSLASFKICSLCLIFVNLINMCLGVFHLGFILFRTLWVFWTWVITSLPILGKFSTIISSCTNHSRILYDPPPRILEIKAKINKWGLIKIKSFYTTKETISKVKRQPSEWEKIIANEATDKELISKYTSSSGSSIPEK